MLSFLRNNPNSRLAVIIAACALVIVFAVIIAFGAWQLLALCLFLLFVGVVSGLARKKLNGTAAGRKDSV